MILQAKCHLCGLLLISNSINFKNSLKKINGKKIPTLCHELFKWRRSQKPKIVERCSNKFWIPIRRNNESKWIHQTNTESGTEVDYLPWKTIEDSGIKIEHEDCVYVIIEGTSMNYSETTCGEDFCFACQISNQRLTFSLKGSYINDVNYTY